MKIKRVSDGWRHGLVNIKHLFWRVTLLFDHYHKLYDEHRRNNELKLLCLEPWHENSISVLMKQY
jgi:hypothetical protein